MIPLHPVDPDPAWEMRTRLKCHVQIARRAARRRQAEARRAFWMTLVDAAAAAALCAYLSIVIREAGLL